MRSKPLAIFSIGALMLFSVVAQSGAGLAADSPEMVALGKALFFDDNLSQPDGQSGENYVDLGLGGILAERGDPNANAQKQKGKFKIPSLRNVARTAPYEHNGVFKTLKEVVMFNNSRDVPEANYPPPEVPENVHRHMPVVPGFFGMLGLTNQEVNDIVAFLRTLTDGYIPEP